ncbi:MAG: CAP domain-containing protein [Bacteroidales bacterium]|nr:CAP domain-containing protein [Bacteroidales bacterium]
MKKFLILIGIVALGLIFYAASCLEDITTDDENDDTSEAVVDNNNGTQTEDNNNSEENNESNQSGFSKAEIAKANTAANVEGLSQMEKDMILYCNLARLDGAKFWEVYGKDNAEGAASYVSSLETDLKEKKDLPMLMPEKSLMVAAAYHANDMSKNNFFSHSSSDGTSFSARVRSYYGGNGIAENISAGVSTALGVVMQLLVDDGVSSLGHRVNILNKSYNAIGVKTASHQSWGSVTVQDFGDQVIDAY